MVQASEIIEVGAQVRRRRIERGWTLDIAASRLGVSRRLLVQIEAGDANPSLNSLLSIATGFEVPLTELLAAPDAPSIAVQPDNSSASILWTGVAGSEARLLVASGGLELWEWTMEPGDERRSEAHRPGSREALTVTAGSITIEIGGAETLMIEDGQSVAFPADVDHVYRNDRARAARFVMAVHESD